MRLDQANDTIVGVTRRRFIRSVALSAGAVALASVTAACVPGAPAIKTITVTHFGGPYEKLKEIVGQPFEQQGLGKVNYATELSAGALSKLVAQRSSPPFNIMMVARSFALRAADQQLLAPIKGPEVPVLADVHPEAVLKDGLAVAMISDGADIMYDKDRVQSPITSWLDLWRPELRGRIALPSSSLSLVTFLLLSTARALGGSERNVEGAFAKLKELKGSARTFVSDPNQATQLLQQGDILAAPQFSLRIANVMAVAPSISRATPKEGVPAVPYDLCIPAASPDQDISRKYVNFVLSESVQKSLASNLLAAPVNRNVKIDAELAKKLAVPDFSKLWFFDEAYVASKQAEWMDRWTREIQG